MVLVLVLAAAAAVGTNGAVVTIAWQPSRAGDRDDYNVVALMEC